MTPIPTARLKPFRTLYPSMPPVRKAARGAVFSDETGDPINTLRKSWVLTAVLAAHTDVTPHWRKQNDWKHVTRACQETF